MEEEQKDWTISQVSKMLDMPIYSLRRYCNSSLLPGWRHRVGKRRVFTLEQVDRLRIITGLHKAGLGMRDIRNYLDGFYGADKTAKCLCRELLATYKRQA